MMRPRVSVIVAVYNAARTIRPALRSVLRQTMDDLEVIVADDGSTDDTAAQLEAIAASDARVRILPSAPNAGPAAARNRCLAVARGAWISVMDADDLMHPERLDRLLSEAAGCGAAILADDLLLFDDDGSRAPLPLLAARQPFWVDATAYMNANAMNGRCRPLGYLKPLISAALLEQCGVVYDAGLRIGEDYDLVLRLLLGGARLRVSPALTYFYRRHAQSISHRLGGCEIAALLAAHARLAPADGALGRAMIRRDRMLRRALVFDDLVGMLKQRRWGAALRRAAGCPRAALMLRRPVAARVQRCWRRIRPAVAADAGPAAVVISRQRLTGATTGSSRYLLDLAASIAACGLKPHLIVPSSAVFGRTPVLRLGPQMRVFGSIRLRRVLRLGPWVMTTDPRIWRRAVIGVLGELVRRAGWRQVAPYSVAVPWSRPDLLFVARHAGRADAIVADYAFTTPAIAYALRPDAPSLVVMHDLFSDRTGRAEQIAASDPAIVIGRARELRLLAQADAVVAIQPDEAASVRADLPTGCAVIVAPLPITPVAAPQPGLGAEILFVGSKASPNVVGLRRFLDECWGLIAQACPAARMTICGAAGGAVGALPPGVTAAGFVTDLVPFYRRAAVVVMPLPFGSGLKVKLVEALGHGKAIVASDAALQGVPPVVGAAVWHAEGAAAMAAAIISLLSRPKLRARYAAAALEAARTAYQAETCHQDFRNFLLARLPVGACAQGTST